MKRALVREEILFETRDIFGRSVRITKSYWKKIKEEKHRELTASYQDVIETLREPNEVYRSVQDPYIALYYKIFGAMFLVVLVKFVDEEGFVVTSYQTTKTKRKGGKLWP